MTDGAKTTALAQARIEQMRAEARALDERADSLRARADLLRIKADKMEDEDAE